MTEQQKALLQITFIHNIFSGQSIMKQQNLSNAVLTDEAAIQEETIKQINTMFNLLSNKMLANKTLPINTITKSIIEKIS